MAISVKEIKKWLESLPDDEQVCIDDGGLAIQLTGRPAVYLEIGGDPGYDEELESDEAENDGGKS